MIREHLDYDHGKPTPHTILCFIGMIETGECTWDDFRHVAGDVITADIANAKNKLDEIRTENC